MVEVLLEAHAQVAESLLWEPRDGVVYWADIKAPALHRLDDATREDRRWELPEDIGALALADGDASALVALRSGLFLLSRVGSAAAPAVSRFSASPSCPSNM